MKDNGSRFYYSRLTDGEKNLYDRICEALLRFEPALSIHAGMGKAFTVDTKKIMTAVLFDNPVFFYLDRRRVITKQTPMYIQLIFQYDYTKEEAEKLWAEVENRIELFIKNSIKPDMSPLAKQLKVHNFLYTIHTAEEPFDSDCFSVVGALLRDRCVCEGFAKAYKLLCDRLGIASIVVVGEALHENGRREPHSWNITRIKGVTAHTDAAWDSRFGGAAYDYFNLCDADIAADHCFDTELYPKCVPNEINYFYKNGLIARDEDELRKIMADQIGYSFLSLDFTTSSQLCDIFIVSEPRLNAAGLWGIITERKNSRQQRRNYDKDTDRRRRKSHIESDKREPDGVRVSLLLCV